MKKFAKVFLLVVWMGFLGLNVFAQSKDSSLSYFVKGNNAYKEGKYQEAVDAYESILKNGETSASVYYNLGNSYFKLNKLGEAILNYERARRLMPRDSDLESNENYALSLVKKFREAVPEGGNDEYKPTWLQRIVERINNSVTLNEITLLMFFLIVTGGIFYLLALWLNWPIRPSRIGVFVIILIFLSCVYLFSVKIQHKDTAIAVMETPARFEPREDATPYFDLLEGAQVEILRTEGIWTKIKRLDGKLGWIKTEAVEKIEATKS